MSQEIEKNLNLYPIQAVHIGPRELLIKANKPPDVSLGLDEPDCELVIGHSDYNPETKRIEIAIKLDAGGPKTEEAGSTGTETEATVPPFYLRIELVGIFQVDDSIFPADRIYEWAKRNALFVMYPYLKEHAFALTARSGFRPMLLPLIEVPLFRLDRSETEPAIPPSQ